MERKAGPGRGPASRLALAVPSLQRSLPMLTLRSHVIICAALLAALIGIAILGNLLQAAGVPAPTGPAKYVAIGLYFLLFLAFGLSTIPVIVKTVLGAQVRLGNQDVAAVAAAIRQQTRIIWTLWGLIGAGTLIAVPAALLNGALGDAPKKAFDRALAGPSLGMLTARPDMTVAEMVRQSTMKVDTTYARSAIAGGGVFEFRVPGTTIAFPRARSYFITTWDRDHGRIRAVNISTSPEKMPRAGVDSADAALRAALTRDGWQAGHEVYRTEEDRTLHGGAATGPEGRVWRKEEMVLVINRNRMDEAKAGEDEQTAGEWIQYVELWPVKDYSGIERLEWR
jgi:hypothetical protein